eukprot:g1423.t1
MSERKEIARDVLLDAPGGASLMQNHLESTKNLLEVHRSTIENMTEERDRTECRLHFVFDTYDTDKSNTLDLEEFQFAVMDLTGKTEKQIDFERVREDFRSIDVNGDNRVDFKEFVRWFETHRNEGGESLASSFVQIVQEFMQSSSFASEAYVERVARRALEAQYLRERAKHYNKRVAGDDSNVPTKSQDDAKATLETEEVETTTTKQSVRTICVRMLETIRDGDICALREAIVAEREDDVREAILQARPLHVAASEAGKTGIVKYLLERGAPVDAANLDGFTALHIAARRGDAKLAYVLVGAGASVATQNSVTRTTPLHLAALKGHDDVVRIFADSKDVKRAARMHDCLGDTPLHCAVMSGNLKCGRILLERKTNANVNARNGRGATPLHIAVSKGSADIVDLLLADERTDPNATLKSNVGELSGVAPLHIVASQEGEQAIRMTKALLARKDIDIEKQRDDARGRTPLMEACASGGSSTIVTLLLQSGARVSEGIKTPMSMDALQLAVRGRREDVVAALLSFGAPDMHRSAKGLTALHLAALVEDPDIVELLLKFGADPNVRGNDDATPMHVAASRRASPSTTRIIEILLHANADPNLTTTSAEATPLHFACDRGNLGVVKTLLSVEGERTDVTKAILTKSKRRVTPLGLAIRGGHKDIVTLLVCNARAVRNEMKFAAAASDDEDDLEASVRVCETCQNILRVATKCQVARDALLDASETYARALRAERADAFRQLLDATDSPFSDTTTFEDTLSNMWNTRVVGELSRVRDDIATLEIDCGEAEGRFRIELEDAKATTCLCESTEARVRALVDGLDEEKSKMHTSFARVVVVQASGANSNLNLVELMRAVIVSNLCEMHAFALRLQQDLSIRHDVYKRSLTVSRHAQRQTLGLIECALEIARSSLVKQKTASAKITKAARHFLVSRRSERLRNRKMWRERTMAASDRFVAVVEKYHADLESSKKAHKTSHDLLCKVIASAKSAREDFERTHAAYLVESTKRVSGLIARRNIADADIAIAEAESKLRGAKNHVDTLFRDSDVERRDDELGDEMHSELLAKKRDLIHFTKKHEPEHGGLADAHATHIDACEARVSTRKDHAEKREIAREKIHKRAKMSVEAAKAELKHAEEMHKTMRKTAERVLSSCNLARSKVEASLTSWKRVQEKAKKTYDKLESSLRVVEDMIRRGVNLGADAVVMSETERRCASNYALYNDETALQRDDARKYLEIARAHCDLAGDLANAVEALRKSNVVTKMGDAGRAMYAASVRDMESGVEEVESLKEQERAQERETLAEEHVAEAMKLILASADNATDLERQKKRLADARLELSKAHSDVLSAETHVKAAEAMHAKAREDEERCARDIAAAEKRMRAHDDEMLEDVASSMMKADKWHAIQRERAEAAHKEEHEEMEFHKYESKIAMVSFLKQKADATRIEKLAVELHTPQAVKYAHAIEASSPRHDHDEHSEPHGRAYASPSHSRGSRDHPVRPEEHAKPKEVPKTTEAGCGCVVM